MDFLHFISGEAEDAADNWGDNNKGSMGNRQQIKEEPIGIKAKEMLRRHCL